MKRVLFGICAITMCAPGGAELSVETPRSLSIAKHLAATRYKGWTYGSRSSSKKIDCSQFLLAVVEELRGSPLSPGERQLLVISGLGTNEQLGQKILQRDERTKGVVAALAAMKMGEEIATSESRPGDFVQYWYKNNGKWAGHTAIVETTRRQNGMLQCRLFGSHRSSNGIGTSTYWLTLDPTDKVVFVARLK